MKSSIQQKELVNVHGFTTLTVFDPSWSLELMVLQTL